MGENTSNPVVELAKAGSNVLEQFYRDLAQPSVRALGEALGTVFELCPTSLLSLKIWTEKRKLNFKKRLNEYAKKLEDIPEDKRCEVNPQIGTPIVEKLTYTTNDEIADLFTTLLANASNIETVNRAHPAFVEIIARLSPDEARIIHYLSSRPILCYREINANALTEGYNTLVAHATVLNKRINLQYPHNERAYLSNLVSQGIISDEAPTFRIDRTEYDEIGDYHKIELLNAQLVPRQYKSITTKDSYFEVTPLGQLFIAACIKQL